MGVTKKRSTVTKTALTNLPIYRMSSAGECPRALSAQRLNYESEPKPAWLETAANEGRKHEEWIKEELRADDIAVYTEQGEVKLEYPTFILLGHIDGIVNNHGNEQLLEIKSMSQYEFDRWMQGKWNEFPEYADQITCYMEATKLSECLYIVKNRSSGYIDRQIITKKPSELWTITTKLAAVEQCVANKELAPADCNMTTTQCKRCLYKKYCIPTKEEFTIQEEKVLLKAAEDWRRGKELSSEGKELTDNAKKIFEEHTIAAGLQKWSFDDLVISNVTVKEHEVPARLQKESSYIKISDTRREE